MGDNLNDEGKARITRRKLLAATGATAASAAFLAACGGDDDDDAGSGQSNTGGQSATSEPSQTGASSGASTGSSSSGGEAVADRLIMTRQYTGAESNDARDLSGTESWQLRFVYESLLLYDHESGEIIPGLAEEWDFSDPLAYKFTLRQGVQFHGGYGEMTADDVVFSFDLSVADPERGASMRGFIDHTEKTGDYEVTMHMKSANRTAVDWFLTEKFIWGCIMSKAHWEEMGDPMGIDTPPLAGTGPWEFVERSAGEYMLFKRFEDHWRQVPDFKELEVRFVNETSTRLSGLLANESHLTILPPDLYPTAEDRGMEVITATTNTVRVYERYYGGGAQYNIQTDEPWFPDSPMLDLRVRKALNKALDRDALNEAFLDGKGEIEILASHHPSRPGWDTSWEDRWEEEYGYDPDAAKALLEEAGYGTDNPVKIVIIANYRPAAPWGVDMQETMIGYWKEVGVDAELLTVDAATISAQADNYELDRHLEMLAPSSDLLVGTRVTHVNELRNPDPDYKGNDSGVWLPGLDEAYDELISAGDDEEFDRLAREMGEILFVGHALVPLFWIPGEVVVDPKVVAGWVWPGNAGDLISHTEYIEAVKA